LGVGRITEGFVKRFKIAWKRCVAQSTIAVVVIFLILLFINVEHTVVVAAIGASAFIVFAMPSYSTARSKSIIGGHILSLLVGSLCAIIPGPYFCCSLAAQSLAVGLAILIMTLLDVGHPPAAATAFGVSMSGFSVGIAVTLIISVICLALAHHFLRSFLRDIV
jgi:CBS-domain-containing membrane protein